MKNFKLNTKTAIIGYTILINFIFFGCGERPKETDRSIEQHGTVKLYIYTYDSCEYVGTYLSSNSATITHKGNCKFCAERNKK